MAAGIACTAIVKQVIQLLKFVGLNSQSKNENEKLQKDLNNNSPHLGYRLHSK